MVRVLALLVLLTATLGHAAEDNLELEAAAAIAELQPDQVAPAGAPRGDRLYDEQLIGLFVDGRSVATIQAIRSGQDWYVAIEDVADPFAIGHRLDAGDLVVSTPEGDFTLPAVYLLRVGERLYVSSEGLIQTLMFEVEFDTAAYALRVFLPWTSERRAGNRPTTTVQADIEPAAFSLSQLRTDLYYTDELNSGSGDSGNLRTVSQLRGNLGSGMWHAQYATDEVGGNGFEDYYWVRAGSNSQLLAGRDVVSPNPLVPGTEMTGLQWAWSNREITADNNRQPDINSFYRAASNTPRRIEGTAEPGAIAELWVEGTRRAVTRVRLDGNFEFLEVELLGQQYNQMEVLIYNRQRTALLERQDFSQIGTNKLLNRGQTLVYGGGGARGNLLGNDSYEADGDFAGAMLLRRGVASGLTLEASYTDTAAASFQSVGFSSLIKRRVSLDGAAAFSNGAGAWSLEGGSQGENWRAFVSSRVFEAGFRSPSAVRELHQYLDVQYRIGTQLQLYLRGRNQDDGINAADSYLGVGVGWFARAWSIRALPSYNGDLRVESRLGFGRLSAMFLHDDSVDQVTVSNRMRPDLTLFGSLRRTDLAPTRAEFGVDWFPNSLADRNSRMQASLIGTGGSGAGFSFLWQSSLRPGVYADLQLIRDPAIPGSRGVDETRLMFRFTVDFALNGRRFVPAESFRPRLNTGSLSGQLLIDNAEGSQLQDVDVVAVKIDNVPHRVPLRGGYFYLDNVPTGVHRIELDPGLLPIELTPVGSSLWVRIAPGAVTSMDFELEVRTGFAGRVVDSQGEALPYAIVSVADVTGGDPKQTRTDMFGLYRIDGLAPGIYQVSVEGQDDEPLGRREVILERDYLFEQDIRID